jgi:quinol monooxygenase YgiN
MAITRIKEFHAVANKAGALRELLSAVIAVIKDSPGCLDVDLYVDHDDATRLAIVEWWESVAANHAAPTRIPPARLAEVQPFLAEPRPHTNLASG